MGIDIHLHGAYFSLHVPTVVFVLLAPIVLYGAWKFRRFILAALGLALI